MSVFSKLFAAIKKIISKIIGFVAKLFKKLWPLLLAIAAVWFAPGIAGWLGSVGAPSWLTGAFGFIGTNVTPMLSSAWSWLSSAGSSVFGGASAAWSSLSMGTKASLVVGAATLLAPEEMADLASEVGTVIGDTVGSVVGAVGSGFLASPIGMLMIGGLLLWLLSDRQSTE